VVLQQVLRTRAGYVGMLGSRKKSGDLRKALLGAGFAEADVARVHCPIGLDIQAESPAEIALSIVSELVRHRAGQRA
jgi:xanthine dehydrogenase accessory factor